MAERIRYGVSTWGGRFVRAIADSDESARLARGKSYASTGKVLSIRFEGRSVVAKVQGRSFPSYTVRIAFPALGDEERERLFEAIGSDPLIPARIETGDLPIELIDRLEKAKISLFPRRWKSLSRECSCPDWGDPCKHMAAVYYLIAKELDRDPSLIFRLRGVDLAEGLGRAAADEAVLPAPFRLSFGSEPRAPGPEPPPDPPVLGDYLGFVTSLIPPKPVFAEIDFGAALVEFYHRAAAEEQPPSAVDSMLERRFSASSFGLEIKAPEAEGLFASAFRAIPVIEARGPEGKAQSFTVSDLFGLFLGFEDDRGSPGYRFLFHLSRLAFAAFRASAFVPAPLVEKGVLRVAWVPLRAAAELQEALAAIGPYDPGILIAKPGRGKGSPLSGRSAAELLSSIALTGWTRRLGFRPSGERASVRELTDLFFSGGEIDASKPGERTLPRALAAWLSIFNLDFAGSDFRYRFDIVEDGDADSEAIGRFAISLSVLGPKAEGSGFARPVALKDAVCKSADAEILRIPAALASYVPEIRQLSTRKRVSLDGPRLAAFLGDAALILRRLGVEVVLPKGLRNALSPRLVLSARSLGGRSPVSYLDLKTMLSYDWRVAIGDRLLSPLEFARLVKGKKDIVLFRDGFVRIDPDEIARLLERARAAPAPTALEVVAARLSGDAIFDADAEELAASLLAVREEPLPAGLAARLRPYQERGYRWAVSNLRSGFGCLLADDMGLGKTVQAIAVILRLREEGLLPDGTLVVAPAALMTNWARELGRFAPRLRVSAYHGKGRSLGGGADLFLTTYETAARDAAKLADRGFSLLVCDEAQLMKNAGTRRARSVKSIGSAYRMALSGTPVENRLEDLRSIFDLVLPGYLGGPEEFSRKWRSRIEGARDAKAAEELRRITSPFLMRRLKTDKAIAPDLPDKIVSDEYASLVPEQAALYESVVRVGLEKSEAAETAIKRSAAALTLLTSLKQICDHPRVYDKESPPSASLSGKCVLLLELLGEMLERRDKVLVFSQYVETLDLLRKVIADELGEPCLVYHGGMAKKARDAAVDSFQGDARPRVMLVSLRAGGLGLNLTAACRVVHYDLWFNPAVENQATDRAFRIGQDKNVFVHRIIAAGTFEERIDAMIKSKRELAGMSVSSGESWIAKMSVGELRELFAR